MSMMDSHKMCNDPVGPTCTEDCVGKWVCMVNPETCCVERVQQFVRCIPDPEKPGCKKAEKYCKNCAGEEIECGQIVGCPPGVFVEGGKVEVGGGVAIEGPITIDGPLDVNVLNTVTVDPSANFTALLEGVAADIVAAIEAGTADITAALQAICDKLEAGITVNAVQSGEWVVAISNDPLNVSLDPQTIADLIAALEAADLTVTIGGQDVVIDVNITNDPLVVTIDPDSLPLTVVIDTSNGPVEVTGTVSLDGPITIDWSNVPTLDVNIVDSIALTIGELPPVVWDETQFNTLIDTINEQIRCDYEHVQGLCAFNAAGDKIPNVAAFRQICYQGQTPISNTQVWSQLQPDGTWGAFVFADGATAGECAECPIPVVSECFVKYTRCVGYDNGVTPGSSTNDGGKRDDFVAFSWNFTVKGWLVNGTEVGAGEPLGAYSGWTPQLEGWAAFFNANMPASVQDAADDKAAFGFLPAPTWRYAKITTCDPEASFGPLRIERDDGVCYTIYPQFESTKREYRNRVVTMDCAGKKTVEWCDNAGNPVEAPEDIDCWYPCSVLSGPVIEGPDGPDCKIIGSPQKVCDKSGETQVEIYRMVSECDGVRSVVYYTVADWEAGEIGNTYTPVGELVDCETGDSVALPCDTPTIESCPDECATGSTYINGRPPASNAWSWGPYSGNNLNEFEAALTAAGYTVNRFGEKHQICPPFGAFGEDAEALVQNGIGDGTAAVVEPNIDPNYVAKDKCAMLTTGKNDDRRDDLLMQIYNALGDDDPCAPKANVWCDSPDGTKYVTVSYPCSGTVATFLAEGYDHATFSGTAYEPTGEAPQVCDDAAPGADDKCIIDACGDRWTCSTLITPLPDGTPITSEVYTPWTDPCAEEAPAIEGRELVAKKLAGVRQVKVKSVVAINTSLTQLATDLEAAPVKNASPVGPFCDCACGADKEILDKLCDIYDVLNDAPCPEDPCPLIVGTPEFAGEDGGLVTFPLTSPPNATADYMVPISLASTECLAALDPTTPIVVRWHFDHSIDPSSSHTGFNVGGTDGTAPVGTVVGQSGGNPNVMVGPAATPHTGPRDDYWVDIEFTVADLLAGVAVQTSAFGTVTTETETIHSQRLEIVSGLADSGCC